MAEATVLALDLGTSSLKGALYSSSGERLALTSAPCSATEPAEYLSAAARVCQEIASAGMAVGAVGLSTQTPTLIFCDGSGNALTEAIIWQDSRAGEESRWLMENYPDAVRREWFGMDLPIGAAATPPKVPWMARHAPDIWRRTRWVLQPKEFLLFHLTGVFAADRWCSKGLINLATGEPAWPFLEIPGKSEPLCPALLVPDSIAGRVANNRFGLPSGTLVTTAC